MNFIFGKALISLLFYTDNPYFFYYFFQFFIPTFSLLFCWWALESLYGLAVAEQAGLGPTWSETQKTIFLVSRPIFSLNMKLTLRNGCPIFDSLCVNYCQGIFLGLIWDRITAPSQFINEQKFPKMVYIIANFLVLQFGENFMKIWTKIVELQLHENLHKNMFSFTFLCKFLPVFLWKAIKTTNMLQLYTTNVLYPCF